MNFLPVHRRDLFLGFALLGLTSGAVRALAAEQMMLPLRLAMMQDVPLVTDVQREVVIELYRRAGIPIVIEARPITRSILETDTGIMDGELGRFSEVENNFQGIVRVPEPVMRMQYRAAFIDTKFGASAASLESLARSGLRVGVVKGTFILEAKLGKAITGRTSSHESLAEMLINKHIDVAIGPYGVFEPYLKASPASKVEYSQVLDTQPMYHYLNKRHADLVPVLTETLRNMKRDGTLRNIWSKHK